ncbi:MAG TPA: hemerythrin family protein [Bryobacteraceae bacterium]|nr:hemerythrin family protein [Bryobacteraceae bacterium]
MRPVKWNSAYAIYVSEIDSEHRAMFQMVEALQRAANSGKTPEETHALLRAVMAHTIDHFSHEERLMRAAGYSGYRWHKRQHEAARRKLTDFSRRIQEGEPEALSPLLDYLAGWLKDHIGVADSMMAASLRNHQRVTALPAS